MKEFIQDLFEYNYYQNQKLIQVLLDNSAKASERSVTLFSHLLIAHNIWTSRIYAIVTHFGIWEKLALTDMQPLNLANFKTSLHILQETGLDSLVTYKTSKGESFTSLAKDILFHCINHSTYHRGQIATEMRNSGIERVPTDYIVYKR